VKQLSLLDREVPVRRRSSFHVRSHFTVEEVVAGEKKARRQEDNILEWFRENPTIHATPTELFDLLPSHRRPLLTSLRRALTNLTTAGFLRHYPAERRDGKYGVKESCWGLATRTESGQ